MENTLGIYHRVLSFAGIPFFAEENWSSKFWLGLQIFNFIIGVICFILTTAFVGNNLSNLPLFIQGACVWTTGVIMTITLGICLFFRTGFRRFLNEMVFKDNMFEMPLVRLVANKETGKLYELRLLVEDSQKMLLKYAGLVLICYVGAVWLCVTLYLCSPIILMVISKEENMRLLAFDMWFPWSLNNFKIYVASFTFHAYCGYLCCIAYPGLQSTIILLIGQIIRQLKILTFILLNLNELAIEMIGDKQDKWQPACTALLAQCVDHYVSVKRFSNRLNVICRPFYLALILVAIMLVCMCSVKIAISNKMSLDILKYFVHELCFILVVLMFCLLGQQVENECALLEKAVMEKWYIFNQNHKRSVLIFNLALSQRMPIFIFGSITLSLPTFTWFIKTGMSFFTLVMSVLEEQE